VSAAVVADRGGTGREPSAPRRVPGAVWWGGGLLAAVLALWLIGSFLFAPSSNEPLRKPPQITVLRLPPPPPPKPPEKLPEPPKIKEEIKLDTPKPIDDPKPADAPPPGPLGVDAQGTGPGDAFGLAGRPGGRDVTLGGAGGGGLTQTLFANGVARHIAQELARQGGLRQAEYRIELRVWLTRDGRIERFEMARGSGDTALDRQIEDGLMRAAALRQPIPDGMAQPLRIRVTSADG
jgi:protein TonB